MGRWVVREKDGIFGVGEASPLPGYSRDPQAAERFAEEMAELDLQGQRSGLPAWRILGGEDPTPRPVGQLVKSTADLLAAKLAGAKTIKIKELTLAEPAPRNYRLRVDLNGRDQLEQAIALQPELIEEPQQIIPSPIPLALDESLAEEGGFERALALIDRGLVQAVVLKPMLLGGFLRCLELAREAQKRGAAVIVTHMMDRAVAHAAATHLAFAIARGRYAHGLGLHANLDAHDVPHLQGFELLAPTHPGVISPELRQKILAEPR